MHNIFEKLFKGKKIKNAYDDSDFFIGDAGMEFETKAIHAIGNDALTGAVTSPIYQTSTFSQEAPNVNKGFDYSRTNNPTRAALEKTVALLEEGKYGIAFASGMAAINGVMNLLKNGDHVVCCSNVYGGTFRLFTRLYNKFGVDFDFIDMNEPFENKIKKETRFVWIETPTNPLLTIIDIKACAETAHRHGALLVVDNTFASPYNQKPLSLGADIVVHSTTKYLGGHSDLIGGCVVVSEEKLKEELAFFQNAVGAVPGPFDAWLTMRGIKTLCVRMKQHNESASKIADYLLNHQKIEKVYYPGLENHPNHEIAKKQMRGFGGIVSVEVKGGFDSAKKFACSTKLFTLAESLGGVKSLISHSASMTHASIPKEEREKAGISDSLIRLSVGLEATKDLIIDLEKALENV